MFLISYRRDDTAAMAGRIYDRLQAQFGADFIYRDFDSIPVGVDFRTHVSQALGACLAVVVIIGPNWAAASPSGVRRIDNPEDFVRTEVSQALSMDIPVLPVLIDATLMPGEDSLPEELRALAFRNAIRIDSGIDFNHHIERLCAQLGVLSSPRQAPVAPLRKGASSEATVTLPRFSVQPYLGITEAFRNIQKVLIREGLLKDYPDGVLGPKTLKAVQAFQQKFALPESEGAIDKKTIDALFDWERRPESPINQEDPDLMRRYLQKPSFVRLSEQIEWVQQTLRHNGCYDGPTDGIIRPGFLESVREFQAKKHLEPNGSLGYDTLLFAIEDEINRRTIAAGITIVDYPGA